MFKDLKPDTSIGGNSTVSGDLKSLFAGDKGRTVAHLVEALLYKPEGCGFNSRWCQRNFFIHIILPATLWPGVDSTSNRNEYQDYFLGVKAAGT